MKRFLVVLVAIAAVIAFGATLYADQSNYGCGLGSIVFQGKEGLLSQTCAATLNGTSGQISAITTGTSNCKAWNSIASNEQINKFVADNMDNLAKDVAKGNGEYLNTFAVLMQVKETERSTFYSKLQSNFSKIFTSEKVNHNDVLNNIESVLKSS
ncbi:MAG: DUF3015 family protein [Spirochaetota bacterium]